jgi:hypothetical protein
MGLLQALDLENFDHDAHDTQRNEIVKVPYSFRNIVEDDNDGAQQPGYEFTHADELEHLLLETPAKGQQAQ